MSKSSKGHPSTTGASTHRGSKLPSPEMTPVPMSTPPCSPTSEQRAQYCLHGHTSFPTSQNAFLPRLTCYSYNNTMKKVEKSEQYVHVTKQPTPGSCFLYLPLQVTCYPLNPLNPREERHRSKFLPFSSKWNHSHLSLAKPQMPLSNPSSLPCDEASSWWDLFSPDLRIMGFLLLKDKLPVPCPPPPTHLLSPGSFSLWGELCPASSAAGTERWRVFDLRGVVNEWKWKESNIHPGRKWSGASSGPDTSPQKVHTSRCFTSTGTLPFHPPNPALAPMPWDGNMETRRIETPSHHPQASPLLIVGAVRLRSAQTEPQGMRQG